MLTDPEIAREWLAAELDRIWLITEQSLRALQRAGLRPQPEHPQLAEVEAIFAARRRGRGSSGRPADPDAELAHALNHARALASVLLERTQVSALATKLSIDRHALEVLLIALAPEIDPPLADAFAVVRGGPMRRAVDLALIARLHRLERPQRVALHQLVAPQAPLVRWRLLQIGTEARATERSIRPTADALELVRCSGRLPASLDERAVIVDRATEPIDPSAQPRIDALCAIARHGLDALPRVVAWGPRGAGKRALAARLAMAAGRFLVALDLRGVPPAEHDDLVRRGQREALIRDALLFVGPLPAEPDEGKRHSATRWMDGYDGPVVLGVESHQPPRLELAGPIHEIELGVPDAAVRLELWERALPVGTRADDLDLPRIARSFRLTAGELGEVAHEASVLAACNERGVSASDVRGALERRLRNDLGKLARRIETTTTWDDLVLPAYDIARIRELVARARFADRVYRDWGFGRRVGYGKGLVALFSGPPGTGKTMIAGLIGAELGLDVYQVDLAQVFSKWVGETEKHLGALFDEAERAHAVLLFDEADALFGKRTDVDSANDRYANLAVNYLLQRLESYSGVGVMTTNKEAALDPALARRLSLHLRLEIPRPRERLRLWRSLLPAAAPLADDIDLAALARDYKLAGGQIKNIVVRAAFFAAEAEQAIDQTLLRRAAVLELEDMGHVVFQRGRDDDASDDELDDLMHDVA